MRTAAVIAVFAVLGLLLQTTLPQVIHPGAAAPDLLLILCVYLGLRHHTVGGAVGAFALGYMEDAVSGGAAGINAFGMSLVFVLVYLTSRRLWVDNLLSRVVVVFLASVVKTAAVVSLLTLFLSLDELRNAVMQSLLLQPIMAAAIASPVFALLAGTQQPVENVSRERHVWPA